ncbi:putative cell-cycle-associated protein kinase CLK [Toxoplasma gondii CAST]|uniref:Putative cell-cycle-associated protein kinase CLK n=3 Tax=Toxoplasma gondii TaxID=5811 RepID=A0A3R8B9W2_TOXGO|nr:putative cell-cycle-associated protein kinase CLK [Toxoplasma gondii CAST]
MSWDAHSSFCQTVPLRSRSGWESAASPSALTHTASRGLAAGLRLPSLPEQLSPLPASPLPSSPLPSSVLPSSPLPSSPLPSSVLPSSPLSSSPLPVSPLRGSPPLQESPSLSAASSVSAPRSEVSVQPPFEPQVAALSPHSPSPHAVFSPLLPFSSSLVSSLASPVDAPPLLEAREEEREPSRWTSSREERVDKDGGELERRDASGDRGKRRCVFSDQTRSCEGRLAATLGPSRRDRKGECLHAPCDLPATARFEPPVFCGKRDCVAAHPGCGEAPFLSGEEADHLGLRRGRASPRACRGDSRAELDAVPRFPWASVSSFSPALGVGDSGKSSRGAKRRDRDTRDSAGPHPDEAGLDLRSQTLEEKGDVPQRRERDRQRDSAAVYGAGRAFEEGLPTLASGKEEKTENGRGRRRRRARARRRAGRVQVSGRQGGPEASQQPTDFSASLAPGDEKARVGEKRKTRLKSREAYERSRVLGGLDSSEPTSRGQGNGRVFPPFYALYAPLSSPLPSYVSSSSSSGFYSSSRGVSWTPQAPVDGLESPLNANLSRYFSCSSSSRLPSSFFSGTLPSAFLDVSSIPSPGSYFSSFVSSPLCPSAAPLLAFQAPPPHGSHAGCAVPYSSSLYPPFLKANSASPALLTSPLCAVPAAAALPAVSSGCRDTGLGSTACLHPGDYLRLWRYHLWCLRRNAERRRASSGSRSVRYPRSRRRSSSSQSSLHSKTGRGRAPGCDEEDRKRRSPREARQRKSTGSPAPPRRSASPRDRSRSSRAESRQRRERKRASRRLEASEAQSAGEKEARAAEGYSCVSTPRPGEFPIPGSAASRLESEQTPLEASTQAPRVPPAEIWTEGGEGKMGDSSSSPSRRSHRRRKHEWGGEGRRERTGGSRRSRTRYRGREEGRSSRRSASEAADGRCRSGEARARKREPGVHTPGATSSVYCGGAAESRFESPHSTRRGLPSAQRDGHPAREGSANGAASLVYRHHKRRDGREESEGNRSRTFNRSKRRSSELQKAPGGRDSRRSLNKSRRPSDARDRSRGRDEKTQNSRNTRGDAGSSRGTQDARRRERRKARRSRSEAGEFLLASRQTSRERAKRRKEERRRSDDSPFSRKRRREERPGRRSDLPASEARERKSDFSGGRREGGRRDERRGGGRSKRSLTSSRSRRQRQRRSESAYEGRRDPREPRERERRRREESSCRRYEPRRRRYEEDSRYPSCSARGGFLPFFYPSQRSSLFPSVVLKRQRPGESFKEKSYRYSETAWREGRREREKKRETRDERGTRRRTRTRRRDVERRRAKKKEKKEDNGKDDIIHFDWRPGMWLTDRYRVLDKMGEGTFGRVLRCADVHTQRDVAIKVVRDVSRYTSAAKIEVDILREINERDAGTVSSVSPAYSSHCVRLHDAFLYKGRHMCLVFEKLGKSLYDLLTDNHYQGFYLEDIRTVAKQCLIALAFLRVCRLTHTDLKPENILLLDDILIPVSAPRPSSSSSKGRYLRPAQVGVKIIDFGSATFEDDYHSSLINTRQYRAPEVILGLGWDMSSDVWSLGCILMELYTGNLLFRTHEHLEHLAMMEKIIGPMPANMLEAAVSTDGRRYLSPASLGSSGGSVTDAPFSEEAGGEREKRDRREEREESSRLRLNWPEGSSSTNSEERVRNCVPLQALVLPHHRIFSDFVASLLQIDPQARPTPGDALMHPFFSADLLE